MSENCNAPVLPTSFNPLDSAAEGEWAAYTATQEPARVVKRTGLVFTIDHVGAQEVTTKVTCFTGIEGRFPGGEVAVEKILR